MSEDSDYDGLIGWGNRGWLDIVEMVLETCKSGALKTHIMYRCNLNSAQVRHYLDFLECVSLIDRPQGGNAKGTIYKTTEKGLRYIGAYVRLGEIFRGT